MFNNVSVNIGTNDPKSLRNVATDESYANVDKAYVYHLQNKKEQSQSTVADNVIDKDASNLKQERKQKPDDDAVLHATHSNKPVLWRSQNENRITIRIEEM